MKKFIALFMSAAMYIGTLSISTFYIDSVTVHAEQVWPSQPSIYGTAGCLIEASTGTVLYEKKAHQKMYPASITKILTALVTLENCELDEEVTFSEEAVYSLELGDAHMQMNVGEVLPVEDCLYGLMLQSANEVATALAEHVGGSVEGFAQMMNDRAKEAGALNSNFMNANGLHNDNHYITAYDMAMITRAAVQNPLFVSISGTTEYTVPATNKKEELTIYQRHKMTRQSTGYYYEGILGGKTGFTDQSGTTLVTYAERNGMTLIAVVLQSNGTNVYDDTKILLDYGFENFNLINVSENDTRFEKEYDSYTDRLTPVFGNNDNSSLQIDTTDSIVLPKEASFSDVTSSVSFGADEEATENSVAKISYSYGDKAVGTASIIYVSDDISDNSVSAGATVTDKDGDSKTSKDTDTKTKFKVSTNNKIIKNIITVALNLIVLVVIILLVRKKQRQLNEIRAQKRRRRY